MKKTIKLNNLKVASFVSMPQYNSEKGLNALKGGLAPEIFLLPPKTAKVC